jgi:hypothetical protein
MKRQFLATTALITLFSLAPAGVALGAGNPSPTGTGQPNQSCEDIVDQGGTEPGHASSSPGSAFNENGGIGGEAYDQAGAPSQYDVACYQVTQPH